MKKNHLFYTGKSSLTQTIIYSARLRFYYFINKWDFYNYLHYLVEIGLSEIATASISFHPPTAGELTAIRISFTLKFVIGNEATKILDDSFNGSAFPDQITTHSLFKEFLYIFIRSSRMRSFIKSNRFNKVDQIITLINSNSQT